MKYRFLGLAMAALLAMPAVAQVRVPRLVGDHMVLQRDVPLPVWGWAAPGETIKLTFRGKTYSAKAGSDSTWRLTLDKAPAGGPHVIAIAGKKDRLNISDVLVGDVWIASGQSNMEWKLKQEVNNWRQEVATADLPQLRVLNVDNTPEFKPAKNFSTKGWELSNPAIADNFSAIGFMFCRALHKQYQVPIGLIQSEWGGTPAEAWTSIEALKPFPHYEKKANELRSSSLTGPQILAKYKTDLLAWGTKVEQLDEGNRANPKWRSIAANTADWGQMPVPSKIEAQPGLGNFDGIIYLRRDFNLSADVAAAGWNLALGKVDDADSVWINGKAIGGTANWGANRNYWVGPGTLRPGVNTIIIRVTDVSGDAGIMGIDGDVQFNNTKGEKHSLAGTWQYKVAYQGKDVPAYPYPTRNQNDPTTLFNGMINPLVGYAIKGVIWYQGESNAGKAYEYRTLFPTMITDWRTRWNQGNFPFLFVQLANYRAQDEQPTESDWAELREAQAMTLSLPATGMATAIDIGEANDIHPRNKQDVAQRLFLTARRVAYGEKVDCYGPMYQRAEVKGNRMVISFTETANGLMAKDRYGYVKGFAIAGSDKKWHWAQARIIGPNQVEVYSETVSQPVAVRYAWGNNPSDNNLYNTAKLPAFPFRTDDWPGITQGK